jgi:hypothetical protein
MTALTSSNVAILFEFRFKVVVDACGVLTEVSFGV